MVRREIYGKKLAAMVRNTMPDKQFRLLKEEGVIAIGMQRLVRLEVTQDSVSQLLWNDPVVQQLQFPKQQLAEAIKEQCRAEGGGDTRWSP